MNPAIKKNKKCLISKCTPQLSIKKWVCLSIMLLYHYGWQLLWTHWVTIRAKNSIKNAPASAALTQVSHQSHNACTTNRCHLCSKEERNGAHKRTRVSFCRIIIQALELLWLVKRHISGQSDIEEWRNQACSNYRVMLVWRYRSVGRSVENYVK